MGKTPLQLAIDAVGTQAKLASLLGVTAQAVNAWDKVPAERCIAVEEATAGKVTRYQLRPDVFGAAPAPSARRKVG